MFIISLIPICIVGTIRFSLSGAHLEVTPSIGVPPAVLIVAVVHVDLVLIGSSTCQPFADLPCYGLNHKLYGLCRDVMIVLYYGSHIIG